MTTTMTAPLSNQEINKDKHNVGNDPSTVKSLIHHKVITKFTSLLLMTIIFYREFFFKKMEHNHNMGKCKVSEVRNQAYMGILINCIKTFQQYFQDLILEKQRK